MGNVSSSYEFAAGSRGKLVKVTYFCSIIEGLKMGVKQIMFTRCAGFALVSVLSIGAKIMK